MTADELRNGLYTLLVDAVRSGLKANDVFSIAEDELYERASELREIESGSTEAKR